MDESATFQQLSSNLLRLSFVLSADLRHPTSVSGVLGGRVALDCQSNRRL